MTRFHDERERDDEESSTIGAHLRTLKDVRSAQRVPSPPPTRNAAAFGPIADDHRADDKLRDIFPSVP